MSKVYKYLFQAHQNFMYKFLHPSSDPSFSAKLWSQTGYGTVQSIPFPHKVLVPLCIPCKPKLFLCFPLLVSLPFVRQMLHLLVFISWLFILQEFLFLQANDSFLLVWECYLWLLWMDFFPILVYSEEVRCRHLKERKGNHPSLLVSCTICKKPMHIA